MNTVSLSVLILLTGLLAGCSNDAPPDLSGDTIGRATEQPEPPAKQDKRP